MKNSIFVFIPKTLRATECEQHRNISLKRQVVKLLIRVIMIRIGKIRSEVAEEEIEFEEWKSTMHAFYALRIIAKKAIK